MSGAAAVSRLRALLIHVENTMGKDFRHIARVGGLSLKIKEQ